MEPMVRVTYNCLNPKVCTGEVHTQLSNAYPHEASYIVEELRIAGATYASVETLEGGQLGAILPNGDVWAINPN